MLSFHEAGAKNQREEGHKMSKAFAEIENAKKIIAEQKARIKEAQKNARAAERRLRNRQNYILGGALITMAANDERAVRIIETLLSSLNRPADKKAFEAFSRLPKLALRREDGDVI